MAYEVIENPALRAHDRYLKGGTDYRPALARHAKETMEHIRASIRGRAVEQVIKELEELLPVGN